jgi:hypothetical protein
LFASLTGAAASLGASLVGGSTMWAGVSGDDDGFEVSDGFDDGWCGNLASAPGDSASTMTLDLVAVAFDVDILVRRRRRRARRWCCGVRWRRR